MKQEILQLMEERCNGKDKNIYQLNQNIKGEGIQKWEGKSVFIAIPKKAGTAE